MSQTQPTIYFIEDDPDGRLATQTLLELSGWRVCSYGNAEEFLGVVDPLAEGCILADFRLPGMSGLQMFHRLRERGITLPLIILSGHAEPPTIEAALAAGVAEFLLKPVISSQLRECVRRQLGIGSS